MGHAHHFLSRLDRLTDYRHLEDAKLLYNHADLLQVLLERAHVPADCERVAISLSDPEDGPWVITTRDGKFVTCLADGMRPAAAHARVPPELLKGLTSEFESQRGHLDAFARYVSRTGAPKEEALLGLVHKRPAQVAREDVRALAGLALLAPDMIVQLLGNSVGRANALAANGGRCRTAKHQQAALQALHDELHAQAHLAAALYAPAPSTQMVRAPELVLPHAITFLSQSPAVAARGLWSLRDIADLDLGCVDVLMRPVKHDLPDHVVAIAALSLVGGEQLSWEEKEHRLERIVAAAPRYGVCGALVAAATQAVVDPNASVRDAVAGGQELYMYAAQDLPDDSPLHFASAADVPEETALATIYSLAGSHLAFETDTLPMLVAAAPHFLKAPLEALYLPRSVLTGLRLPDP